MSEVEIIEKRYTKNNEVKELRNKLLLKHEHVSISHKDNLLIGIGANKPCGVDVESISVKHHSFLNFVLSQDEQKFIIDPILGWVIKEACFKVCNDGYEPGDFIILNTTATVTTVVSDKKHYKVKTWKKKNYLYAVATLL